MSRRQFGRLALALLATALAGVTVAQAHGPTRQKVVQSVEIKASPAKIWAVIGNFHDMSWDPAIVKTEGTGGNTVNSLRTLTLKSGGQITESLDRYDAAEFSYSTFLPQNDPKVLAVSNFSTVLTVTAGEGGKSIVEWRAAAYRGEQNNDPPPELNDDAAVSAMTAYLTTGLDALKMRFEGS
jgi:hypothetical protein